VWVRRGYCGLSTHMTKQQEFPQHTMLNQTHVPTAQLIAAVAA